MAAPLIATAVGAVPGILGSFLTYYGMKEQNKMTREGWNRQENMFNLTRQDEAEARAEGSRQFDKQFGLSEKTAGQQYSLGQRGMDIQEKQVDASIAENERARAEAEKDKMMSGKMLYLNNLTRFLTHQKQDWHSLIFGGKMAQIPQFAMPDVAGQYARLGEQVTNIGNKALSDYEKYDKFFKSEAGKKQLVEEIKSAYPEIAKQFSDQTLLNMDIDELGKRVGAVVMIQQAVPAIKEIDPQFAPANINSMYAEAFARPELAPTVVKDWKAVAEKNKSTAETKQADTALAEQIQLMKTGMPLVQKGRQGIPISDAELEKESTALLDGTPMPPVSSQVEKYKGVPIREQAYGELAGSGVDIAKISPAAREMFEKSTVGMKDIATDEYRNASLAQKRAAAKAKMFADMQRNKDNADIKKLLIGQTAIKNAADISDAQADLYLEADEIEAVAKGDPDMLALAEKKRKQATYMAPRAQTSQALADAATSMIEETMPAAKTTANAKKTEVATKKAKAETEVATKKAKAEFEKGIPMDTKGYTWETLPEDTKTKLINGFLTK